MYHSLTFHLFFRQQHSIVAPICSNDHTHTFRCFSNSSFLFCTLLFFAVGLSSARLIDNTKSLANGRIVVAKSKLVLVSLRLKRQQPHMAWLNRKSSPFDMLINVQCLLSCTYVCAVSIDRSLLRSLTPFDVHARHV